MASDGILTDTGDLEALRRLPSVVGNTKPIEENGSVNEARLDFEKNFDDASWLIWFEKYWWLSLVASVIYVLTIFSIQHLMKSRKRFELRGPLIVWNIILAVFSIFGTIRSLKAMYITLTEGGWHESVCDNDNNAYTHHKITGAWALMFTASKVVEFGDTIFIVLRKGKLIFLHWYHHITVLAYVCLCYSNHTSIGYWFMVLNFPVHAVMYTYYGLRAARVSLPKSISMGITTMQLVQMIGGCIIQYYVYYSRQHGRQCKVTPINNLVGSIMYVSYLILFAHFFYTTYMTKKPARSVKQD